MALANIGVILAQWGKKILLVDWDLEAPGLENYFRQLLPDKSYPPDKFGLIDLLDAKAHNPSLDVKNIQWSEHVTTLRDEHFTLDLMTCGRRDELYIQKVKKFDFSLFYQEHDGGDFLEDIRDYWKNKYDYVLIDSRTGLTDSSGICSIHMPDILVLLFTATEQGFKGTLDVVLRSTSKQSELIYDRLKLKTLPIPTRFDNSELKLTEEWLDRFAKDLHMVYGELIPSDNDGNPLISPMDVLKKTKVPYVSFFSYGEKLPVLDQGTDDPNSIGYVYETIAAILANNFTSLDQLKDNRDQYIKAARGEEVFDYSYFQRRIAEEQAEKLRLEALLNQALAKEKVKEEKRHQINQALIIGGIIAFIIAVAVILYNNINKGSSSSEPYGRDTTVNWDSSSYITTPPVTPDTLGGMLADSTDGTTTGGTTGGTTGSTGFDTTRK